ncbi:MAG: hydrolase, partial [Verrucomicrobiota bacterium]
MNLPPSLQLSQADRESMTSLLIEWANINSGSENLEGLNRMLSTLEKEFCRLPAEMKRLSLPSVRRTDSSGNEVAQLLGEALHLKCRPTAPLQILFSGHMDTVYSQHHAFQRCEIRGSQLHGPGVADMKGGLVVLLKSLEMFEKSPFHDQIGWEILISSDEEIGSPGSAPFLKEAADRHHLGLVFEASLPNGNLVKNRKGSGHFKIKVEGKSAHVGRDFSQGRNAIVALADFTLRIHQLNGEFAGTILNVGKINGGTALNVVPHHAEAQLNIRVDRFEEIANIQNRIHTIIQSIESLHEVQVQWSGSFNRPPKEITPEIEKAARLSGMKPE